MYKKVSICLCTYNGAQFITEQLWSVLDQTYPIYEIIVVDDHSKDNTIGLIRDFNNPKIKLFHNTENIGYIKNFEKAVSLSSGELIALCDQDDIWHPEKIEKLVKNINKHDLIYHNSEYIDKQGNKLNRDLFDHKKFLNGQNPLAFVYGSCITGHTLMFKEELKKYILPFPHKYSHDWWIGFVASCENGIIYLNEILTKYRHHENNVIAGKDKRFSNEAKQQKLIKENFERIEVLKNYKNISNEKQEILKALISGYRLKENSFFSFNLFKTLFIHRKEILALNKGKLLSKLSFMIKESIGTKLKEGK